MEDIASLKAGVSFRALVEESHSINRGGKVHCPYHDDRHPSCHIYQDGFKCFACGVYGDHIDWLEQVYQLSTARAIAGLRERSSSSDYRPRILKKTARKATVRAKSLEALPLSERELRPYHRRLKRLRRLPKVLEGRGLVLEDLKRLGIAAVGEDALFPILDPVGKIVALKRRFFREKGGRYAYLTTGHGSPAWASPGCRERPELLVVEGELNGMVSWLAFEEAALPVGIVAPAGAHGKLYPGLFRDKRIFLYADDDEAGRQACARWRVIAIKAGAAEIMQLTPFQEDACELAGRFGRAELVRRLSQAMFDAALSARLADGEELSCDA